jgi:hypothetical protein
LKESGVETRWLYPLHWGSGLATNALVRESVEKALSAEISVPQGSELLVLFVEVGNEDVICSIDIARILFHAHVVVTPVVAHKLKAAQRRLAQLEAHLRVTHEVAVLFAIVGY